MNKIKKGDIVGRKSYGKDIFFTVVRIIDNKKEKIAILNGVYERIEADSTLEDLEIIPKKNIQQYAENFNKRLTNKIKKENGLISLNDNRTREKIISGRILHLDGECSFIYTLQSCLNTEFKKI